MNNKELLELSERVRKADICHHNIEVFMKLRDSLDTGDATFSVGLMKGKPSFCSTVVNPYDHCEFPEDMYVEIMAIIKNQVNAMLDKLRIEYENI